MKAHRILETWEDTMCKRDLVSDLKFDYLPNRWCSLYCLGQSVYA